ncbi:hypothetical protein ACIRPT_19245 [Streptomyces sp. NPDC101227]|uniref:hypothetical protein n=1 Tax=Streptomyces sp. NPDC101227 TaxID=3366136 RepID=UPI0037FCBC20
MSGKTSVKAILAYAAGFLVALVAFVVLTLKGLTAAGLTGTHGTFTVKECSRQSTSRHSTTSHDYECDGTFRSDDGKVVDNKASMSNLDDEYDPGVKIATQGHSGSTVLSILSAGTYTLASRGEVIEDFSLAFFAVLLIVPYMIFAWRTEETGGPRLKTREAWRSIAGTRTRKIVIGTAAAALFGMIVVAPALGFALTAGS